MSEIENAGEYESKSQQLSDPNFVAMWLKAIALSEKREENWFKSANEAEEIFKQEEEKKSDFNILYSNIQTEVPAIYNSPPLPDCRRRFRDDDAIAKDVSQILERALSHCTDIYNFDGMLKMAVLDRQLVGRGGIEIVYEPVKDDGGQIIYHKVYARHFPWKDLRIGPARCWEELPWMALPHYMTREELVALSPEHGEKVPLNTLNDGFVDEESPEFPSDIFKRALVWKIWDRESQQVIFIAKDYKNAPISISRMPFNVQGFFPVPKPSYANELGDSLTPTVPYSYYQKQADELNQVTKRIRSLVKAMRWRGFGPNGLDLTALESAGDGEIVPSGSELETIQGQDMEKRFFFMPVDRLIIVLRELIQQREAIKATIYEITGISDILRGSTQASETATAQEIKNQWGSLRLQMAQADVQRMARDAFRIMAEIIAEKFDPATLSVLTGIQVTDEHVKFMRDDQLRSYRIDIETDSTIRADLTRSQKNISEFVRGFGGFIQSVGPAVQAGVMPIEVAVEMISSFSRVYKLGRQVEDALDKMKTQAMAPKPPEGPQPNPEAEVEARRLELETQKALGEHEIKKGELFLKNKEIDLKEREFGLKQAEFAQTQKITEMETQFKTAEFYRGEQTHSGEIAEKQSAIDLAKNLSRVIEQIPATMAQVADQTTQAIGLIANQNASAMQQITKAINAPKEAVRDKNGKLIGTRTIIEG